jgi:RimJ/RimL family protein N-acetyltransferase
MSYDAGLCLETARLLLRPPRLADLDAWAQMMGDAETAQYIGGVQTRSQCWRGLMTMIGAWISTGCSMFSVIEKRSGEWLGRLGPWQPEGWPGTEVGWGLRRSSWGKGYAYEGTVAAIDYAFTDLGWDEVIHTIAPDNLASQRLAERLGSVNTGRVALPAPFEKLEVEAWRQGRAAWFAYRARHGPPASRQDPQAPGREA